MQTPPRSRGRTARAALITLLLVAIWSTQAWSSVPKTIAIEGRRPHTQGGSVADGKYALTFSLYATKGAKQAAWMETAPAVTVKAGTFQHALGSIKALNVALIDASKTAWLGLRVGNEPELSRQAIHSAPFALRAAIAESLSCTGCVSLSALKADGDLDLGGNAIKAKLLTTTSLQAGQVTALSFQGDGSKLTGLKIPTGSCKQGEVMVGIAQDGKIQCAQGATGGATLEQVSKELLTTQYAGSTACSTLPLTIKDNNPIGTNAFIDLPDIGDVQQITVSVKLHNSDISGLKLIIYDPTNAAFVLHEVGSGSGKTLDETWPVTAKPVSGDLGVWKNKNPKGKWRLQIIDKKFFNNGEDGAVTEWTINRLAKASDRVSSLGLFVAKGGLATQVSAGAPQKCTKEDLGRLYYDSKQHAMFYCDGDWRKILIEPLCGNNVVNSDETCDDGNTKSGDGCTSKCQTNVCGDGVLWPAKEECDDGNTKDGDDCSSQCKSTCKAKCSNGSCVDCNPAGQTLVKNSAFVDPAPPAGWTQCFGFVNTSANDVSPKAPDNCLGAKKLRLRIFDAAGALKADVYANTKITLNAWPASATYITQNLTLAKCSNPIWPCNNSAGLYGATNGTGGGGCGGYATGGMPFSNGNGGQVTVSAADLGGKEIWHGKCYGNKEWLGYKAALYK